MPKQTIKLKSVLGDEYLEDEETFFVKYGGQAKFISDINAFKVQAAEANTPPELQALMEAFIEFIGRS